PDQREDQAPAVARRERRVVREQLAHLAQAHRLRPLALRAHAVGLFLEIPSQQVADVLELVMREQPEHARRAATLAKAAHGPVGDVHLAVLALPDDLHRPLAYRIGAEFSAFAPTLGRREPIAARG